jgi:hypothetical protein
MITVILQGGLGNQMFQFAAAKALALKLKTNLILDLSFLEQFRNKEWSRHYELDIFDHKAIVKNKTVNRFFIYIIPHLKKNLLGRKILSSLNYYFSNDLTGFQSLGDNTTLFGYFTSEIYFMNYRQEILAEFIFKNTLNEYCRQIEYDIKNSNSVSVHVRRGDYLNEKNTAIYFQYSLDWYLEAFQIIKQKIKSPVFYFFSDDINWVKKNFSFLENAQFIDVNNGLDSYNDMRLMSMCKHNIIANSTFSWWGAWLNTNPQKIVIAPKKYYRNEIQNGESINIFSENWTLL